MAEGKFNGRVSKFKCADFDISKFSFTTLDTSKAKKGDPKFAAMNQYVIFPQYDYGNERLTVPVFQTGIIKINQYGIPKINTGSYYKDEKARNFIKISLDPEQESCVELETMFKSIDDYMGDFDTATKYFGQSLLNRKIKPKYIPNVREPQNFKDEEDEENEEDNIEEVEKDKTKIDVEKKEYVRHNFIKMKFDTKYDTNEVITTVFKHINGEPKKLDDIRTVEDIAKNMGYNNSEKITYHGFRCSIRIIGRIFKAWLNKTAKQKDVPKEYGIGIKILQLEIIEDSGDMKPEKLTSQFANYSFDEPTTNKAIEENKTKEFKNLADKIIDKEKDKTKKEKININDEEENDKDEEKEDENNDEEKKEEKSEEPESDDESEKKDEIDDESEKNVKEDKSSDSEDEDAKEKPTKKKIEKKNDKKPIKKRK
jgi:hypothetical protein